MNIIFICAVPFLPFVYILSKKRRANLLPRLGFQTGFKKKGFKEKKSRTKRIWVHALSVGEVISAVPFVQALKEEHKDLNIVFTASTKTGFDMAEQLFLKKSATKNNNLISQLGYFPFDLGFCVRKISRLIEPDAVVLVETDLWPGFLYEMEKSKVSVILINARLSKRSLKGYLLLKSFSSMFFSSLTAIMAQTALDKKRFQAIGINKSKISVVGNIKFDQACENMDENSDKDLIERFGVQHGSQSQIFIAGSTHEGEEKILCNVYNKLIKKFPGFLMIIAPRDPKRCHEIQSYLKANNIHVTFMSSMGELDNKFSVVLVDKMGVLSKLYAVCDVAFIGGSMVEQGGHNPLEAAAFSKPLLFGPDMSDFELISNMLMESGGARMVESEIQLSNELEIILEDRQIMQHMGNQSFEVFSGNSGAVQRIIENMQHLNIV